MREYPRDRALAVIVRRLQGFDGLVAREAHLRDHRQQGGVRNEGRGAFRSGDDERIGEIRVRDVLHEPVGGGFQAGVAGEVDGFFAGLGGEACGWRESYGVEKKLGIIVTLLVRG